jgi:hypothetical protein
MEVFLLLNGFEIQSSVDEQERIVLQVAKWIGKHLRFGFAIVLPQAPEGRRLTIRFSPIANSDG